MKNSAVIIAGGAWQVPIIKYLKEKGYRIIVVDPYPNSKGVQFADKYIQCDVREAEKIKTLLDKEEFSIITSDQSDVAVNTVAYLCSEFNLTGNPIEVTNRFVNKYSMRQHCLSIGIPTPAFAKIRNKDDLHAFISKNSLPIILKPADSQSSRGVVKIDPTNIDKIGKFVKDGLAFSNCGYLIAEQFLEGREVTVEGFASNYRHRTLAISLKEHFRTGIASSLEYPADIPQSIYDKLEIINDRFVEKSGLKFGITHAEYMIDLNTEDVFLIEIACRGGGTLISSDIVNWVSGLNLYDCLYENLLGKTTDIKSIPILKRNALLKFFEFPSGKVKAINGVIDACSVDGILCLDLGFNVGDTIFPASDDRSRQGFFIAFADSKSGINNIVTSVDIKIQIIYE